MDTRVEDYLNDKLQTFADFETIDALITNVQSQQALLQRQLDDSRTLCKNVKSAADGKTAAAVQKARSFEKQQNDIDERLKLVTRSETSDDAVQRFERSMKQIEQLDIAEGYFRTLKIIDEACQSIRLQMKASPEDAIHTYSEMHTLLLDMETLHTEAEGAAPHLVDYVRQSVSEVHDDILGVLKSNFEALLQKILWPKPNIAIPESTHGDWNRHVNRLLLLQRPDLEADILKNFSDGREGQYRSLLPLELLVKPLEARFQYHFSGNRPTNRLDKPEYFMVHILDLLNSHVRFIEYYIQPCIIQQFKDTPMSSHMAYMDAITAFITALLPMVRTKVNILLPQLSAQPQLFSHFIHELIKFDDILRDEWHYTTISEINLAQWKGLTWEVLTLQDQFGHWLQVEKDFSLSRYQAIIEEAENNTLDYDSLDSNATKPTKAALCVKDLLEMITKRYRPLSSFSQKLSFLIDIQITILDKFHSRLHSSLEAFISMSSTIGRTVQGVSAADVSNIQGVSGLDRICRVFGSADLLGRAMRDWSYDILFIDLWAELQARSGDAPKRPGTGTGSRKDIEERASELVKASLAQTENNNVGIDVSVNGTLFDETAAAYSRLRVRSEGLLVDTITNNLREPLRPYIRSNPWSSLSTPDSASIGDNAFSSPSADLSSALSLLTTQLSFLKRTLAPLPLKRVARQIAKFLNGYLFDRILLGHSFSVQGAVQVRTDMNSVMAILDVGGGAGTGSIGLAKCLDAARLLTLPVKTQSGKHQESHTGEIRSGAVDGEDEDSTVAAWDDDGGGDRGNKGSLAMLDDVADNSHLSIEEAEQRIFASNESARKVLVELEIYSLSEAEARQILQRRV